jgi:hypothetical protein
VVLAITVADLTPAAVEVLTRPVHTPVPDQRTPHEAGWTTAVRDNVHHLLAVLGCTTWTAETVEPAHPVTYVDQQWQEIYQLDNRFHIVQTITRPAGRLDRWTITVNGQAIAHRARPGVAPHSMDALITSVWRHLNGYTDDPCDLSHCAKMPTTAVYGGGYCADHLHLYEQR